MRTAIIMSKRRTNKHMSKRHRNAELGLDENGCERLISVENARSLCNALIADGSSDLERSIELLQKVNDELGKNKHIIACSNCGKKVGISKCGGCRNPAIRYCSRDCQLEAWPAHRQSCCLIVD